MGQTGHFAPLPSKDIVKDFFGPLPMPSDIDPEERLGEVANALGLYEMLGGGAADAMQHDWKSDNWDGDAFANLNIGPNNYIYLDGPDAA